MRKKTALLSGPQRETEGADIIFATVQTMCKPEVYRSFRRDEFDLIIIDEAHRCEAAGYRSLMEYFTPALFLGMSASPERTDAFDVYAAFDHNIACEIRLQQALEYDYLCPFHYFGISDFRGTDSTPVREPEDLKYLVSEERVKYILGKLEFYGCSGSRVRGLIFCSRTAEAEELSKLFNLTGRYRTTCLSGESSQEARERAVALLESTDPDQRLDYIFTVDIFNEGVDIPCINQVVLLRPTRSPIVFVQQLGRGLRKYAGKEFVVIIDLIANYAKNYLIPLALYGYQSYSKEELRRYMHSGSRLIPGASTVSFDEISRKRIFESLDRANFSAVSLLLENYCLLKHKLGRIPRLREFDTFGYMDVCCIFGNNSLRSYHNFLCKYEKDYQIRLDALECRYLEFISRKLAGGKRNQELLLLQSLLSGRDDHLYAALEEQLHYRPDENLKKNFLNILSGSFARGTARKSLEELVFVCPDRQHPGEIRIDERFKKLLGHREFRDLVQELTDFGLWRHERDYRQAEGEHSLVLYKRYSYEEVCRCLNWAHALVPQNIGGYKYDAATRTLPVFVNYHKGPDVPYSIRYEDRFLGPDMLSWISKNRRTPASRDVRMILEHRRRGITMYLFVRKNQAAPALEDGRKGGRLEAFREFYFLGEITPAPDREPEKIVLDHNPKLTAVRIEFLLRNPVRPDIYAYLTTS